MSIHMVFGHSTDHRTELLVVVGPLAEHILKRKKKTALLKNNHTLIKVLNLKKKKKSFYPP